jgi:hypothetical protein
MNAFWKNRQFPQGLKPTPLLALDGAAKAAPLQRNICANSSSVHEEQNEADGVTGGHA